MKNTWKIAMVLALSLCLVMAFVACGSGEEDDFVYVTDTNGETVTDTNGTPVTAPDTNTDGVPDDSQTSDTTDTEAEAGNISVENVAPGDNYGEIHTPNN